MEIDLRRTTHGLSLLWWWIFVWHSFSTTINIYFRVHYVCRQEGPNNKQKHKSNDDDDEWRRVGGEKYIIDWDTVWKDDVSMSLFVCGFYFGHYFNRPSSPILVIIECCVEKANDEIGFPWRWCDARSDIGRTKEKLYYTLTNLILSSSNFPVPPMIVWPQMMIYQRTLLFILSSMLFQRRK